MKDFLLILNSLSTMCRLLRRDGTSFYDIYARQVGKSTVVKQVLQDLDMPYQFFSADNVPATKSAWISDC